MPLCLDSGTICLQYFNHPGGRNRVPHGRIYDMFWGFVFARSPYLPANIGQIRRGRIKDRIWDRTWDRIFFLWDRNRGPKSSKMKFGTEISRDRNWKISVHAFRWTEIFLLLFYEFKKIRSTQISVHPFFVFGPPKFRSTHFFGFGPPKFRSTQFSRFRSTISFLRLFVLNGPSSSAYFYHYFSHFGPYFGPD